MYVQISHVKNQKHEPVHTDHWHCCASRLYLAFVFDTCSKRL